VALSNTIELNTHSSAAVGESKAQGAVHSTVLSAAQLITGAVVSTTVTVRVTPTAALPAASLTS